MEAVLNFRTKDAALHATSFTVDAAHARQRHADLLAGQAEVQPHNITLRNGRLGHDYSEAERTAVAELLGGGGRGFVLLKHESAVTDWHDSKLVSTVYYKEIQELVERLLPGVKALPPSDHVIRTEEPPADAGPASPHQGPAAVCHNDFAQNHGTDLQSRAPEIFTAQVFEEHRVLQISTWRNIDTEPMQRLPLAICDRLSMRRDDLQAVPLVFGDIDDDAGQTGWADIYFCTHSQRQRWVYFPELAPDEVILLVQYDSDPEVPHRELTALEQAEGGHGFIPPAHSAVELPRSEDARPRISLDFRMICLAPKPKQVSTGACGQLQNAKL